MKETIPLVYHTTERGGRHPASYLLLLYLTQKVNVLHGGNEPTTATVLFLSTTATLQVFVTVKRKKKKKKNQRKQKVLRSV